MYVQNKINQTLGVTLLACTLDTDPILRELERWQCKNVKFVRVLKLFISSTGAVVINVLQRQKRIRCDIRHAGSTSTERWRARH